MLAPRRKPPKLFSDFNTLEFASVMALVVFVVLLVFLIQPTADLCHTAVDVPRVLHPIDMRGADREDAMLVMVTRDGQLYFGADRVAAADLPARIQGKLKDRGVERKVYIMADMRARWGAVEMALDGVHSAGMVRVAFLTNQGRGRVLPN